MGKVFYFFVAVFFLANCSLLQKKDVAKSSVNTRKAKQHIVSVKKSEMQKLDRRIAEIRRKDLQDPGFYSNFKMPKPLNQDTLYSEVIKAYRAQNESALHFYAKQLTHRFPQSVHNDNALFLIGQYHFKKSDYPSSLKFFQQVIESYTTSNKRPSALLMKARAYSELNLKDPAIKTLEYLRKEYPGSPEYFQAEAELELLHKSG